jgi:hypothetical protein
MGLCGGLEFRDFHHKQHTSDAAVSILWLKPPNVDRAFGHSSEERLQPQDTLL